MAYGSARYSAYQKKNKGVIVSEVQSSRYGQKNTGSTLGYVGGNFAAGLLIYPLVRLLFDLSRKSRII